VSRFTSAAVLVTESFWPMAESVAGAVALSGESIIRLPVQSVNANYGTEDDLRKLARDAAADAAAKFRKGEI
jgi:hypothetical protein